MMMMMTIDNDNDDKDDDDYDDIDLWHTLTLLVGQQEEYQGPNYNNILLYPCSALLPCV